MDLLTSLLNTGLSSDNPQINNYCTKTIADMMRGDYNDKEIVCHMNALTNTTPLCASQQKRQRI
jgi:hypothetical protein